PLSFGPLCQIYSSCPATPLSFCPSDYCYCRTFTMNFGSTESPISNLQSPISNLQSRPNNNPTINPQHRPCDKARLLRGQERIGCGHLCWLAQAAERGALAHGV